MKLYYYDNDINNIIGDTIFLAGPTVRPYQTHLTSWRKEAIEEFKKQGYAGNLLIPEFSDCDKVDTDKDIIVKWEYDGLHRADCIMFWIPRTKELIGLTTNVEFGYWMAKARDRITWGYPDSAYRMNYLRILWELECNKYPNAFHNAKIHDNLSELVEHAIQTAHFNNIANTRF